MQHFAGLLDDLTRWSVGGGVVPPFYSEVFPPPPRFYNRNPYLAVMPRDLPIRERERHDVGHVSTIGKDGFQVCMDVTQFKPSELVVKVVDNCVIVEGEHDEREDDHGYIKRHFVRRYALPKGYDADKVASTLSSDGVLTISVPKPAIEDKQNERVVQIQQVGPAHLNVKENPKLEDIGEEKDAD